MKGLEVKKEIVISLYGRRGGAALFRLRSLSPSVIAASRHLLKKRICLI